MRRPMDSPGARPAPSSSVSIRPATAADLPALVAMRDALNDLERAGCPHAAIQRMTPEEFASVWGPTLDSPTHCWRVVESAGRPVGFGMIYLLFAQLHAPAAFIRMTVACSLSRPFACPTTTIFPSRWSSTAFAKSFVCESCGIRRPAPANVVSTAPLGVRTREKGRVRFDDDAIET